MPTTELYFEAHVTFEPVFDEKLTELRVIATKHGFKVAELLMKKRVQDTPERSQFDTFASSRDTNYDHLLARINNLMFEAGKRGFKVWRYKIEDTLLDVRLEP